MTVAGALPSGLAPIGLLLAAAMSVTNVMTDVWRKRALDKRDLFPATFWIRIAVTVVFALVLLVQILRGVPVVIRDAGLLFGLFPLAPMPTFFIYLVLDVGLITIVMWLYFRALQISPLSMCIPFLAFTPVFLIPSTYIILGQKGHWRCTGNCSRWAGWRPSKPCWNTRAAATC